MVKNYRQAAYRLVCHESIGKSFYQQAKGNIRKSKVERKKNKKNLYQPEALAKVDHFLDDFDLEIYIATSHIDRHAYSTSDVDQKTSHILGGPLRHFREGKLEF